MWDVVPPDESELPEKPTTLDLYKVRIEAEVHGEPQEGDVELWDKDVCTFRLVDQNGLPLPENEFRLEWRIKMTKRSVGKGVLQGYGSYGSQNRTYPCIF